MPRDAAPLADVGDDAPDVTIADVRDAADGPDAVVGDSGSDVPRDVAERDVVAGCGAGMTNCGGACIDTTSDVANCGGCRIRCAPANAGGACVAGACRVAACTGAFADCDGAAGNGCEVNLASDANHCGGCPSRCALDHATSACASGRCLVAGCDGGFADCNSAPSDGCEVNINTTPTSCGACGRACALPNASGVGCADGACTVTVCAGGLGNCDGASANGCEADLESDPANCGACGRRPTESCNLADDTCNGRCDEGAGCRRAVYRYYNTMTGQYLYTISRGEPGGASWITEGDPAFYLYHANPGGLLTFYRCRWSGGNFYTTSASCEDASGAVLEGTMGFIATTPQCGALPLYRLYRAAYGNRFYTNSAAERDTAIASGRYASEGIAGYVWLTP